MAAVKSTATVTFTNMVDQKAVVEGNGSLTNGDTNFTYKATATSTDLEVQNGVTAGAITIDASAATTATVTSTGAANVVGVVDLDKATSVTSMLKQPSLLLHLVLMQLIRPLDHYWRRQGFYRHPRCRFDTVTASDHRWCRCCYRCCNRHGLPDRCC